MGIPQEIGRILQGTLLLSAVIAFEVVRRYGQAAAVRDAAAKAEALERRARLGVAASMTATTSPRRRRSPRNMTGFLDDSPPYVRPILFAVGGLALLSLVRILADAPDLTAGRHLHRRHRRHVTHRVRRPRRPVLPSGSASSTSASRA